MNWKLWDSWLMYVQLGWFAEDYETIPLSSDRFVQPNDDKYQRLMFEMLVRHSSHPRRMFRYTWRETKVIQSREIHRILLDISFFGISFGIIVENGTDVTLIGFVSDEDDTTINPCIGSDFIVPKAKNGILPKR